MLKKYSAAEQVTSYTTDFNAAVMSGVNVNDNGQIWTPFNSSMTSLSVDGSTDRRIKVTCTDVNTSRVKTTRALAGGYNYTLRFTLAQDSADKRMFLNVFARIGGAWTATLYQGLFYFGTGNNLLNVEWPAGADSIRVEFLRFSTPASYDGLTTPYYIDNFSISRLDTFSKRKVTVCDPPPAGEEKEGLYRYGFNGKENDNEVKGLGNQQDYGMRIYDPRLGRFLSVDPLTKDYPWYAPYQFAGNKPILFIDLDGLEEGTPSTYVRPTHMPAALPIPSFKGIINITVARNQEVHQTFQGNFLELKKKRNSAGAIQMVNSIVGERWNGSVLKIQLVGYHQEVQKNWEQSSIIFMNEYTYSLEYTNEDGDVTTESGSFNYPFAGVNFTSVYDIAASLVLNAVFTRVINGPSLLKNVTFTQRELTHEGPRLARLLRWAEVSEENFTKASMETMDFTRRLGRRAIQELKDLGFTKKTFEKWKKTYENLIESYKKSNKDTQVPKSRLESVEKILKLWDAKK